MNREKTARRKRAQKLWPKYGDRVLTLREFVALLCDFADGEVKLAKREQDQADSSNPFFRP